MIPTQVDASSGRKSIIVPGRIVGASVNPSVDALATVRGRALAAADDGRPVVELERNFAKHYGLATAGTIRLAGGREVRYLGQALAPEYFVVTAPGADFGAEAGFAVVFTSLRTAQSLSGERGRVNELVLDDQAWRLAREDPGRARPLAATRGARHRIHVHRRQPGGRASLALQGRRRRSADDEYLRRTAARSSGVRRVQSRQPHGRGAAPRDRDRDGARRATARRSRYDRCCSVARWLFLGSCSGSRPDSPRTRGCAR